MLGRSPAALHRGRSYRRSLFPSLFPPFLAKSSLIADCQARNAFQIRTRPIRLVYRLQARLGTEQRAHRGIVPPLADPASTRGANEHKDLHAQGKDFLATRATHTKNSSRRKSRPNAVYFAGCGARALRDADALIGNMTPHMKGREKNNEMILISLTVPGWPSLLRCHQMASALLLLPDQSGPRLQERKSTVWHQEALDASDVSSCFFFSFYNSSLSFPFFPPSPPFLPAATEFSDGSAH